MPSHDTALQVAGASLEAVLNRGANLTIRLFKWRPPLSRQLLKKWSDAPCNVKIFGPSSSVWNRVDRNLNIPCELSEEDSISLTSIYFLLYFDRRDHNLCPVVQVAKWCHGCFFPLSGASLGSGYLNKGSGSIFFFVFLLIICKCLASLRLNQP